LTQDSRRRHGHVLAVDAKLRLAPVGAEPDPTLRRLGAAERS
jgi:hypothetical protein